MDAFFDNFWQIYRLVYLLPGCVLFAVGLAVSAVARRHERVSKVGGSLIAGGILWLGSGLFWPVLRWGLEMWPQSTKVPISTTCDAAGNCTTVYRYVRDDSGAWILAAAGIFVGAVGVLAVPLAALGAVRTARQDRRTGRRTHPQPRAQRQAVRH